MTHNAILKFSKFHLYIYIYIIPKKCVYYSQCMAYYSHVFRVKCCYQRGLYIHILVQIHNNNGIERCLWRLSRQLQTIFDTSVHETACKIFRWPVMTIMVLRKQTLIIIFKLIAWAKFSYCSYPSQGNLTKRVYLSLCIYIAIYMKLYIMHVI